MVFWEYRVGIFDLVSKGKFVWGSDVWGKRESVLIRWKGEGREI